MKSSVKGFIVGVAIGLVVLPVSVSAAQRIFDSTMEVKTHSSWQQDVYRYDDPDFKVKCWISEGYYKGGISCLPWDEVKER